jgi:branched-chain amino acid transport system substrate-binding protein
MFKDRQPAGQRNYGWLIILLLTIVSSSALAIEAKFRIGVVRPQSGPAARLGNELWQGIQLAYRWHRQQTPQLGNLVTVVQADDRGSPDQALRATKKLLRQDRVHALIGSVSNLLNQAVADAAMTSGRFTILPFATQSELLEQGNNLFSVSIDERLQGRLLAQFARDDLKKNQAIILQEKLNPYADGISQGFRETFRRQGGDVRNTLTFERETLDIAAIKDQIIAAGRAELIVIPSYFQDAAQLIRAIKPALSSSTVFLGGDVWYDPQLPQMLPVSANTYFFFSPYSPADRSQELQRFVRGFRQRYKRVPSVMSYLGFATMDTLLGTYKAANSNRTAALKRQLKRPQSTKSFLGSFILVDGRTIVRKPPMMTVNSGRIGIFKHLDLAL